MKIILPFEHMVFESIVCSQEKVIQNRVVCPKLVSMSEIWPNTVLYKYRDYKKKDYKYRDYEYRDYKKKDYEQRPLLIKSFKNVRRLY